MSKKSAYLGWATTDELIQELLSRENYDYFIIQREQNEGELYTYSSRAFTNYEILCLTQILQTQTLAEMQSDLKKPKKDV